MLASFLITILSAAFAVQDTLLQAAVVTALKESVEPDKIASAVSVISSERLERSGISRQNMLSNVVPGLHIVA